MVPRVAVATAIVASAFPAALIGQISPGDLAEPHASLEGSRSCLSCHDSRRGVDRPGCLGCHTVLAERIEAGLGLHATSGYESCETCHIEHQGRDFELIWWGEAGIESFRHEETGWDLEGRHRALDCRGCHRPEQIAEPDRLRELGKNLDRTFLGLETTCASCHQDPHADQFAGTTCGACHDEERFAPASRFDHDASFVLDGAHAPLACEACHHPRDANASHIDAKRSDLRFRLEPNTACHSCHEDSHRGRFGTNCASCHDTSSWSAARRADFEHDLTAFSLRGLHRNLSCTSCHGPSFERPRPSFSACADCHDDSHLGQLAVDGVTSCERCHDVGGFAPSTFSLDDHQASDFPLVGRHTQTACDACHVDIPTGALATLLEPSIGSPVPSVATTRRFRFDETGCEDCHRDPHGGTSQVVPATGCTDCHDLSGWWSVAFVHRTVGRPLDGGHRGVTCVACHLPESAPADAILRFDLVETECEGCHVDPHRQQFARAANSVTDATLETNCERCHVGSRFRPTQFDHQLDSRFPLEGAHAAVSCSECHPRVEASDGSFVRYRPLAKQCSACHASTPDRLGSLS